jgi:hypothetical protein
MSSIRAWIDSPVTISSREIIISGHPAEMVKDCCARKRSENDVLLDSEDGRVYCASCWQHWVQRCLLTACDESVRPQSNPPVRDVAVHSALVEKVPDAFRLSNAPDGVAPNENSVAMQLLYDDGDSVGELTGICVNDGVLYLVSQKRGLAFDSTRTEGGQLRRVGVFDAATGEVELDKFCRPSFVDQAMSTFPYEANPADHCETPRKAYEDLLPVLHFLARALGKAPEALLIYDPYYCAGSSKRFLAELGFANVYNACEDFYAHVAHGTTPKYDVLVTNPPYVPSRDRDHVESLTKFVTSSGKPWLILQPNYVYTKDFWMTYTTDSRHGPRPFFLTPPQPRDYVYSTPPGLRALSSSHRKTSPFVTFFYCWLGAVHQVAFYKWWACKASAKSRLRLACAEFFLPDNFKDSADKTRKKCQSKKRPRAS